MTTVHDIGVAEKVPILKINWLGRERLYVIQTLIKEEQEMCKSSPIPNLQ